MNKRYIALILLRTVRKDKFMRDSSRNNLYNQEYERSLLGTVFLFYSRTLIYLNEKYT